LFNYIENVYYGIRGSVKDNFGNPLKALVKINSHDIDNAEIYSDSLTGAYYRMIYAGTYSLTFSSPGYISKTINNVTVANLSATNLDVVLIPENPYQLALTAIIEGFYDGAIMVGDTVTVVLRNSTAPYTVVAEKKMTLNASGYGTTAFNALTEAVSYYLVVKHRNSIETWSTLPQSFSGGLMYYDFTTAHNQAYGNNMVLKGSKWCIYSGDVNQDGLVDLSDEILVINDANSFASGVNLTTDLNADTWIDLSDVIVVVNNTNKFVSKQIPGGAIILK
jgi:hypothetical protein